ncbi:MAG: tryptophan-rich sensory protein [Bacteroidetes bacterium]|nr:tryptophan-rich sensory protein [Fibrella sp.]
METTNPINISSAGQPSPAFRWYHAVIIFVVANLLSAAPAGYNGDEAFYNNFVQPALAPPDWSFAPAWLFNNVTSLYALWRVANLPGATPGRRVFIRLEIVNWILFAAFTSLYFGLKSPVLGAIDTVLGLLLTGWSLIVSYRIDKKAALNILPRFLWLILAAYVSVYVALVNKDVLLNIGPFAVR